ncbi:hypothetical protein SLA2020_020120 [Shorea laevis]
MLRNSQLSTLHSATCLCLLPKPSLQNVFAFTHANPAINRKKFARFPVCSIATRVKPEPTLTTTIDQKKKVYTVTAVVTVKDTDHGLFNPLYNLTDIFGKPFGIELASTELDPRTGNEKETIKGHARFAGYKARKDPNDDSLLIYESNLVVPESFGEIGAVFVKNEHPCEIFLKKIDLEGLPNGKSVHFGCNSWVQPKHPKRVFFSNKSYLPSETPSGLKRLREAELVALQGDGKGERKPHERIYDYDVYNDLGGTALGGREHPYPRRCRTGRYDKGYDDPKREERAKGDIYVPRDEAFSPEKNESFSSKEWVEILHSLLPFLEESSHVDDRFPYFTSIDMLYNESARFKRKAVKILPRVLDFLKDKASDILQFDTPEMMDRDKFAWFRDEEFSRQTLAGVNPASIQLVTEWPQEWPLKSKLPESLKELVEKKIGGTMTVDEAVKQKRLFVLDYLDVFLPYVNKVRELTGTTLYGSRTLFFLNNNGTLRPIAIELVRPPNSIDKKPGKWVFHHSWDATGCWMWRLAKAHVAAHDSTVHEIHHHWLRTHCATEPYIIAANRQLSAMHPIYRLLHPHFRYTMQINAKARSQLINADGVIESCFAPGKYSMEISSVLYDKLWRFDMEGLPADLIRRGMAVEDPSEEHGLKLAIKDYPYASDGLILWDAIKEWVTDYVSYYYPEPSQVESDTELQAFWTEVRTRGHEDKKDEPWWPVLKTPQDLISILTTIIWIASGHHAAVNFGQYAFGGYFPNRPSIARTNILEDDASEETKEFINTPEFTLLKCLPSELQAVKVIATLDLLSTHSPDEEYIGGKPEPSWEEDPVIKAAFERFHGKMKDLEAFIEKSNNNPHMRNRTGAGVVPYTFLKPFSEPGVTRKGVPNSISI